MEEQIVSDMKVALKARERERLDVLKMMKTAIQMAKIDAKGEFGDKEVTSILKKESKKRAEAAVVYRQGDREELAAKEEAEKVIIDAYLPEQMGEAEVATLVDEAIAEAGEGANFGQIMGMAMKKVAGEADGGVVSKIVKEKTS